MNKSIFFLSLIVACTSSAPTPDVSSGSAQVQAQSEDVPWDKLVGKWQFVYDDARRAQVESGLAQRIQDPAELERAKREAREEAAASVIEFTKDGLYVSRIGDRELMRVPGKDKPKSVTLKLRDASTLVMNEPGKGALVFSRLP